ncbi:MAG: YhbY family RNA-binding protein [Myxococcota bacterium]
MATPPRSKPGTLAGYQRTYLRGLAHPLKPVVQVGSAGVTDAVLTAVREALLTHELIKVRMMEPEDKKAMALALATGTSSALCGLVGHTAVLYKAHPETPVILLPKR